MEWDEFYDRFFDWSDSTRRGKISGLTSIGAGDQLVDAVLNIDDVAVKEQLVRKAMKLGVVLTADDFMELCGEMSDELYEALGRYADMDADNPFLDEDAMSWEDFYDNYSDWEGALLSRRVEKLRVFGAADEVCEVISSLSDEEASEMLYQKAVAAGVHFTEEQLSEMGHWEIPADWPISDEDIQAVSEAVQDVCRQLEAPPPAPKRPGLFAWLVGLSGLSTKKKDSGHCDGDCAHCPAHYGYRYGRWYYGHGHQYGCQRGGNGGASGRCHKP